MLCVFAEQLYFFIMVFRNISQSKRSDLHISSINFCLSINIAQIAASKVQTITHIFYHLPLKVMFHEKICKIDNCNLQNVSVRFLFFLWSSHKLSSNLQIYQINGRMVQFSNSSLWVMGPYFYVAMTLLTQEPFFFHLLEAFLVLLSIDTKVLRSKFVFYVFFKCL